MSWSGAGSAASGNPSEPCMSGLGAPSSLIALRPAPTQPTRPPGPAAAGRQWASTHTVPGALGDDPRHLGHLRAAKQWQGMTLAWSAGCSATSPSAARVDCPSSTSGTGSSGADHCAQPRSTRVADVRPAGAYAASMAGRRAAPRRLSVPWPGSARPAAARHTSAAAAAEALTTAPSRWRLVLPRACCIPTVRDRFGSNGTRP